MDSFHQSQTANEFRASYGRLNDQDGGNSIGNTVPRAAQLGDALTTIFFNDPNLLSLGVALGSPSGRVVNTYQIQDNWTHLAGRHSLKAGVNFTHLRSPNIGLTDYNGFFRFDDFGAFVANIAQPRAARFGESVLGFSRERHVFISWRRFQVVAKLCPESGIDLVLLRTARKSSSQADHPVADQQQSSLGSQSSLERNNFPGLSSTEE